MANDQSRSETFIREVDEELRRDQLTALWKRFAPLIVAVCVLIVAVTAGYRGWLWWHERQAAQAGDRYLAALEELTSGKKDTGEAALKEIAASGGSGYATLARLRLAGEEAAAGDKKAALSDFDAVTNDSSAPKPLRDVARTRAALVALDLDDLEGAKSRATPLDVAGNPWRAFAREVLGTVAYKAGDLKAARSIFSDMQQDAQTPPDLWIRAGLMVALIDGQVAEPTDEAPAGAADSGKTPADGAAPGAATGGGATTPAPATPQQ